MSLLRPEQPMRFDSSARGAATSRSARRPRAEIERDQFGNEARIGRLGIGPARPVDFDAGARCRASAPRRRPDGGRRSRRWSTALGQVITGRRSLKELGGPLKIAEVSGQQASLGWLPFFWFDDGGLN